MTEYLSKSRINEVLYEIHRDIAADHTAARLAHVAAYSEQHFHRIFRSVIGETVNHYIRRTRMEHAANLLMFDPKSPIVDIAQKCGYSSLSSFSKAFKAEFGAPPGKWRARDRPSTKLTFLKDPEIAAGYRRIAKLDLPKPKIEQCEPQLVAYVRHQGYGRSICRAWQILQAWCLEQDIGFHAQYGLHHSNPAWVPLENCRYVACVGVNRLVIRRGPVSSLTIPGGLHARFELEGVYGELLPWFSRILEDWLPYSGFKLRATPIFVRYRKNHFLTADEKFSLDLYLPLTLY